MKKAQKQINVFHFSAGKSSAKMVIDNYRDGDLVIFCDTTREHPKTYKFLNDFEANEGIPVIRLTHEGGWKGMLKKMNGIPNRYRRRCTLEMKIRLARRYLRKLKINTYTQFIGFRSDEKQRVKDYKTRWKTVSTRFPLNESEQTKQLINQYWSKKNYNLEIPPILGNCTLCFMKGEDKIIAILTNFPEMANDWISDEKEMGYTYIKDKPIEQLKNIALEFILKGKVFDLDNLEPKFNCSCTS